MRAIIALWILFTVALLAMLFSCPRSHAQTRIRRQTAYSIVLYRGNAILAAYPEPNGFICVGVVKPRSAECHPSIGWPVSAMDKMSLWF